MAAQPSRSVSSGGTHEAAHPHPPRQARARPRRRARRPARAHAGRSRRPCRADRLCAHVCPAYAADAAEAGLHASPPPVRRSSSGRAPRSALSRRRSRPRPLSSASTSPSPRRRRARRSGSRMRKPLWRRSTRATPQTVIAVGHIPFMNHLTGWLTGESVSFSPGARRAHPRARPCGRGDVSAHLACPRTGGRGPLTTRPSAGPVRGYHRGTGANCAIFQRHICTRPLVPR